MPESISSQLLKVKEIGNDNYQKLRRERFIEKVVQLSDTIHRTNLKSFSTIHEKSVQLKKTAKVNKKEEAHMKRVLEIAKERGWMMDEFQYDVCAVSPLFDDERLMTKSVKRELVQELEAHLSADDP